MLSRSQSRDHYSTCRLLLVMQTSEQLKSVHARHHDVYQENVVLVLLDLLEGQRHVTLRFNVIAVPQERAADPRAHDRLIIDYQHPACIRHAQSSASESGSP